MKKFEVTIIVGRHPITASLLFDKNASCCRRPLPAVPRFKGPRLDCNDRRESPNMVQTLRCRNKNDNQDLNPRPSQATYHIPICLFRCCSLVEQESKKMENGTVCLLIDRRSTLAIFLLFIVAHCTEINYAIVGAIGTMVSCYYLSISAAHLEVQLQEMQRTSSALRIEVVTRQQQLHMLSHSSHYLWEVNTTESRALSHRQPLYSMT
jgi:hypothetical protein